MRAFRLVVALPFVALSLLNLYYFLCGSGYTVSLVGSAAALTVPAMLAADR